MSYANDLPEEGELVVATVKQVKNFGVVTTLDEYPGREGFIHIAEVASGWVKYIRDHVREGQKIVCKVLDIDQRRRKGYVDLSLKAVNEHQKREKIQQWKSEQKAHKLLELVCEGVGITFEEGMGDFGQDLVAEFGSLYHSFEMTAIKETVLEEAGFKGEWIELFRTIARDNVTPPYVEISGILELTSTASNGLDIIKEALKRGEKIVADNEEVKIKINYLGAPKYRVILEAPNYKVAEEVLKASAQSTIDYVVDNGGTGNFDRKG